MHNNQQAHNNISCGVLVYYNDFILLGHATGNAFYDIFKGLQEPNETFAQTAIRELYEESGLVIDEKRLVPYGQFKYNSHKDLYLFRLDLTEEEFNNTHKEGVLHCVSTFTLFGRELPEVDYYSWFIKADVPERVCKSMQRVLNLIWYDVR